VIVGALVLLCVFGLFPSSSSGQSSACDALNCSSEGLSCCDSNYTGVDCYNPSEYTCAGGILCPSGLQPCGGACYNPANYYCLNGNLYAGPSYSCAGYGGSSVAYCANSSYCCGAGGIYPQCLKTGNKCCTHYSLAATQCTFAEVCCGAQGPGASAYAFCCNAGTTCCNPSGTGGGTCCNAGATCCGGYNPWCCAAGTTCGTYYDCINTTAIIS